MHVQLCLSLKSKYQDATASENGEPAASADCGVVAADSLVAAQSVLVSAALTEQCQTQPWLMGSARTGRTSLQDVALFIPY
jgi:hypothetical protein